MFMHSFFIAIVIRIVISVHIIQEWKWFFAFSGHQKIKINFQRPLVLSLGIKPRTAR
jgi:hypothetical protein